jgi:hypothetical protein
MTAYERWAAAHPRVHVAGLAGGTAVVALLVGTVLVMVSVAFFVGPVADTTPAALLPAMLAYGVVGVVGGGLLTLAVVAAVVAVLVVRADSYY